MKILILFSIVALAIGGGDGPPDGVFVLEKADHYCDVATVVLAISFDPQAQECANYCRDDPLCQFF
jgi:hypothetical protein